MKVVVAMIMTMMMTMMVTTTTMIMIKMMTTMKVVVLYRMYMYSFHSFIHSFIHSGSYSEALSVQQRSKRNVLRSLQKEDTLFRCSKRSVRGSSFQVEGPTTEKARRCLSAERARGT